MNSAEVLHRLRALGVNVRANGDHIIVTPASKLGRLLWLRVNHFKRMAYIRPWLMMGRSSRPRVGY